MIFTIIICYTSIIPIKTNGWQTLSFKFATRHDFNNYIILYIRVIAKILINYRLVINPYFTFFSIIHSRF